MSVFAQEQMMASDPRITYVGRVMDEGDRVSFDWSGVCVKVSFDGTRLEMNCSDTRSDYFNIWIDSPAGPYADKVMKIGRGESGNVVLCEGLAPGRHDVILQKRTEGNQGCMRINTFSTDGVFFEAPGLRPRHIEVIGDSFTCGYGTESNSPKDPFRGKEENANLTYGYIMGRLFDADVNLISHSGYGIVRNYSDNCPETNMVKTYGQCYDEYGKMDWFPDMAGYTPDIVVIYLGTNDFSCGKKPSLEAWCNNYRILIGKIRDFYGDSVPILCVAAKASREMSQYVEEAVNTCGYRNVRWTDMQSAAHNSNSDMGASAHPNYRGHIKLAYCMIPYVATLTGWDIPTDRPVE